MKFSEIEWKRQHEMAPDRSLVWAFGQRFVFASEILKGLNAGAVLLTTSDGFARVTSPEFAAERAEDLCVEFDPPNPDPLEDITGRLNAHEERLDDLFRQLRELRELRETLRQPVATTELTSEPPIDVDTLRAICAWIGHVKHDGTMVAETWNRWTLTGASGRRSRVTAEPSGIVLSDGDGRTTLTLAEAHDGQWAADCRKWLNGGDKQPEPPAVKPVEAAALAFVQELQKLAAPVDVVSSPGRWDLSRSGRRVTVLGPTSEQGKFYVHANLGGGGVYLSAEGDHDARVIQLDALSAYLRGA